MEKISIFGLNILSASSDELIELVFKNLESEKKTHIISLNSLMVLRSIFSKKFRNILKEAEIVFVESVGVEIACKLMGYKINKRINGIDFFRELLYHIDQHYNSIYLLGGKLDVVTKVEKNIKIAFPSIKIVGRYDGYFNKEEEKKISIAIQKASPDFTFVALGSPKQEYWINKNRDKIKVAMGVGGSFDIFAGKKKRAPEFFIKNGLEWFYRISTNPIKVFQFFPLFCYFLIVLNYSLFHFIKRLIYKR